MAVVRMPTEAEEKLAFDAYCLLLGRVAYAWNYLFERLGRLFRVASKCDHQIADAIWYAPDSDRVKMAIFEAVVKASPLKERDGQTNKDILWLIERVNNLTDARNNIIHAPSVLTIDAEGGRMEASRFSKHARAKKLSDKQVAVEMDFCERWAERLSIFTIEIHRALQDDSQPWPDRPGKPDRRKRTDLLAQLIPESPK